LSNNGVKRPCEKSNEFGTCIGAEICDGLVGWGPCSAATPEREVCDGIDNDCNGIIDDNPVLPNEPCAKSWTDPVTSIEYTCTANWHCVSVGGGVNDWVCDAPSPEPEVCNGLDDNCDGQVDEDFKVNGKYGTLEHCGACGVSCIGLVEGATEMRCNTDLPKPACEVVSCEPGFWKASSLSCQPFPDTLCQRCSSDRACQVPGDKCEPADSAGRTYCLWSCDPETTIHPELTPGNYCPDGYTCVEHMAALIPGFYCVPDSGSCDCLAPDAGAERLCYNQNAYGRCQGVETCDPEHGWIGCDALVPAQETCNDIDDNCNGYVDELWPTKGAVCSEGIGACRAEGQLECNADGTDLECSATPSAGDPEICDGLDNDCDGLVDELWPLKGSACAIGQGLCYATGIWVCSDDKSDIVCNAPVLTGSPELCDGLDNNCNGQIDEIFPNLGKFCSVGTGECLSQGVYECKADGSGTKCSATIIEPDEEICDGLDNDCDGQIDEDWPTLGRLCSVGIGECMAVGVQVCSNDGYSTVCDAIPGEEEDEICDGLDNDCNGHVDDPWPNKGKACSIGLGECHSTGVWECKADGSDVACNAPTIPPGTEICDGKDNNCNGEVDENFPTLGQICFVGKGECMRIGTNICSSNGLGVECSATAGPVADEICDGLDNNCDGFTDELWPTKGQPCTDGAGPCLVTGVLQCNAAKNGLECSVVAGNGTDEVCDGIDNDCNGVIDDGFPDLGKPCSKGKGECFRTGVYICKTDGTGTECDAEEIEPKQEMCDGKDNNCDGVIDDGFPDLGKPCSKGMGECFRTGVYVCNADGTGTVCNAEEVLPGVEECDGKDNDCNGVIDDIAPENVPPCENQKGVCAGARKTCGGTAGWLECTTATYVAHSPNYEQTEHSCDGLDNDCDGVTDDVPAPLCEKQQGVCAGSTKVCGGANGWLPCGASNYGEHYQATETKCDGLDNDCDGSIDEGHSNKGKACSKGQGECFRTGVYVCNADGTGTECNAEEIEPGVEICNGLDNDCNGVIDDVAPENVPLCTNQKGVCAGARKTCGGTAGWLECTTATYVAHSPNYEQTEHSCDGLDNDCDGVTDDVPAPLCEKQQGVCAGSTKVCGGANGWLPCDASNYGEHYQATETKCDGLDNDCDGSIDEGHSNKGKACSKGQGECFATGVYVCKTDGTGTECNAQDIEPGVEECDGKDNDCNGVIDDIAPENVPPCENQKGVCAGARKTCGGTAGWLECTTATYVAHSPNYEQTEHSCDGLDNDCDGVTDDVPAPLCEKQQGVCAGSTKVCGGANGWLPCDASNYGEHYQATETLCDGLDNDCDGSIDEGHSNKGKACSKGQGECFATGVYVCKANGTGTECNAQEIAPLPEECDGKDNDCNGVIDDVAPENVPPCENQKGVCAGARKTCGGALGWQACTTATYVAHSSKYEQTEHSCDGLDNDCDGVTDDVTAPLCENQQGVCAGSTKVCGGANGWLPCDASNYGAHYQATETKCDGLDNDCDGSIDEGHSNKGKPCSKGQGECFRTGVYICKTDGTGTECNAEEVLPGVEICDGKDNDCNGVIDNGFPTLGQVCYAGVGECQRAGTHVCNADGNGTVCNAIAGPVGNELCDGLDNNCDGYTDEDWPDKGKVCLVGQGQCQASGTYRCKTDGSGLECDAVAGSPTAEVCDYLDNDCNGVVDNGFKDADGRYTADTACANCFTDCTTIWVSSVHHASGVCNATPTIPTCTFVCDEGWVDADQNPDNGCEMQIDVGAVYVSTPYNGGTDNASCGAWNAPCATITYGIGRANGLSRPRVLVSEGIYAENITLVNGISVKGGYSATWRYSPETNVTVLYGTTPSPASVKHKRAVIAQNITSATEFSGFTIYGETNFYQATGDTGGNSYAIWVKNCSSALVIKDNVIYGGQASSGANGAAGAQGANGGDGGVGANAFDTSNRNCPGASSGAGGAGGASTCGVAGGKGADTACPYNNSQRASGANGLGTGAGTGGAGGYDRYTTDCNTGQTGGHSAEAIPGTNGANGANGARGNSCTSAAGSISGDHWVGNVATAGTAGTSGAGGGGGGAGGGLDVQTTGCSGGDTLGSAGGGGGAGGCAGQAGAIGQPGGASIGIFIVGSNGGTVPVISNNFISRNAGGNGGSGGNGGMGGIGGQGGNSGTIHVSPPLKYVYAIGSGGFGGNGGWAGAGGAGGGGCGGNSYGILSADGSAAVPNYCNPAAANTFSSVGGAGNGGAAGTSQGHAQGPAAVNGEANNCKILP
jgi:hypothetical protein